MLIFFGEFIVFHNVERLKLNKHVIRTIIHKEIGGNALKQRHQVRSKAGIRRAIQPQ